MVCNRLARGQAMDQNERAKRLAGLVGAMPTRENKPQMGRRPKPGPAMLVVESLSDPKAKPHIIENKPKEVRALEDWLDKDKR